MIIHDFECEACGMVVEKFVDSSTKTISCECGGTAHRVFLVAPKLDWSGIGAQASASPEFIDKFEKSHKQQQRIEERSMAEHGDYGPRPGAD